MPKKESQNHRLQAWSMLISIYCPEIVHVPGTNIPHVDAISRSFGETARDPREILADEVELSLPGITTSEGTDEVIKAAAMAINELVEHNLSTWTDVLKSHQRDDPDCVLTTKVAMDQKDTEGNLLYRVRDGILYMYDQGYKPLIPAALRKRLLSSAHGSLLAGHRGEHVTFERLRSEFAWPKMRSDVRDYIRTCDSCGVHKVAASQLVISPPATRADAMSPAFLRVEVDTKGPLPLTTRGNLHFITFIDLATRWIEAFPVPDIGSETTARVFVEGVICRHGIPEVLYSDRGTNFTSKEFKQFVAKALGGRQVYNTSYSPRSSGTVERAHRTIQTYLNQFLQLHPNTEWDRLLPYALAAYRSSYHQGLGCSPFEALYGRQFRTAPTTDAERLAHLEDLPEGWILETATRIHDMKNVMISHQLKRWDNTTQDAENPVKLGDQVRVKNQAKQKEQGRYSANKVVLGTTPHTIVVSAATKDDPHRRKHVHIANVKRSHRVVIHKDQDEGAASEGDDAAEFAGTHGEGFGEDAGIPMDDANEDEDVRPETSVQQDEDEPIGQGKTFDTTQESDPSKSY